MFREGFDSAKSDLVAEDMLSDQAWIKWLPALMFASLIGGVFYPIYLQATQLPPNSLDDNACFTRRASILLVPCRTYPSLYGWA